MAERVRAELMAKITASLGMSGSGIAVGAPLRRRRQSPATGGGECRRLRAGVGRVARMHRLRRMHQHRAKVFAYNEQKQAIVINPKGAKFADIVKAAEKCTAGCMHPGHAVEHERAGHREADGAGGEVQLIKR